MEDFTNVIEKKINANPKTSYQLLPNCRGVECDDGWEAIILEALDKVADLDTNKLFRIFVIKEKFGVLRIQYDYDYTRSHSLGEEFNKISDVITSAENKSYHVCERCGGERVDISDDKRRKWISVCDKCLKR